MGVEERCTEREGISAFNVMVVVAWRCSKLTIVTRNERQLW